MTIKRRPPLIDYSIQPQGSCVVYWIHRKIHTDMFTQGYIGITKKRANRRWAEHKRGGHCIALIRALSKHDDIVFDIIVVAKTRDYCEQLEKALRPNKRIGWNINKGGDSVCPSNTYNTKPGGLANKKRVEWLKLNDPIWIEKEKEKQRLSIVKHEALIDRLKQSVKIMIKRQEYLSHRDDANRKISIRNKSGYTGVDWYESKTVKGKWRAQYKGKCLGYFDSALMAHHKYLEAKRMYIKE